MSTATQIADLRGGHRAGSGFLIRCPNLAHEDKNPSCFVRDHPDGSVRFQCFAGCNWRDVRAGAVSLGLIEPFGSRSRPRVNQLQHGAPGHLVKNDGGDARAIANARQTFANTVIAAGTVVETYLRHRCISIPVPPALRFHPCLSHPGASGLHAAMAAQTWRWGETSPSAVHLTYLTPDARKADLRPPRVIYGRYGAQGAGVWFGKPGATIQIAEGIETALSAYELTGVPTVAALSAHHLGRLHLPNTVTRIVIAADHDEPGLKAAQDAAQAYHARGIKTEIRVPETRGHDWNDYLQKHVEGIAS